MRDLRNLPTEVVERLADVYRDRGPEHYRRNLDVLTDAALYECRATPATLADGDMPTLDGYATVYNAPYDICGGPYLGGWTEIMAPGAAAIAVQAGDDVRLLINHEGLPLARTKSGTLVLNSNSHGLHVATPGGLDPLNPRAAELTSAMRRGDADEMSLAFQVLADDWNSDYTERRITDLTLADVSVVTYPANPAAKVGLRSGGSGMSLRLAQAIQDGYR